MPLRSAVKPLLCHLLLIIAAAPTGAQASDLGWMTRADIEALPPAQRVPIPAWCSGTYYNPELGTPDPGADTVITADRSRLVPDGLAELLGDVRVEQPGRFLRADRAQMNQDTGDFLLEGDVQAETNLFSARAASMRGNTRLETAEFRDVEYAMFDLHARGGASRIEQQQQLIHITDGSYTTCPPDQRGWALTARTIELDRDEGWGTARNMTLRVRDIPVLYLPWITFPIDDRRKTGLLFPSLSTGDDGGFDLAQPIYLNIHPQLDAIVAPRFIQNRGSGFDSELRYLTKLGQGSISYGWLFKDRQFDDEDRKIGRWAHRGQVRRWTLEADVNYVSDDFYFKDLEAGLDVRSQTNLPRQGEARYRGRTWTFLSRVQAWQTIDPLLPDQNKPYRRLPQLALSGDPTIAGPLRLLWVSDFTRFDRKTDLLQDDITGDRLHFAPALSLPLHRSWGYIEPRVRAYHTRYNLQGVDTLPDSEPTRDLTGISLDAGLFLERALTLNGSDWTQTLEPRLFYNRVEHKNQDYIPNFDAGELTFGYNSLFRENRFTGYDRIGDEKKLSMGLTSRFLDTATGREVLRLRAGQSLYFEDRRIQLENRPVDTREWSPVVADGTWYFSRYWHLFGETQWDRENNRREQNSLRLGYSDGERRVFHAGYRYRARENIKQTELAAIWPVHRHWSLIGRWLFDMEGERSLENLIGAEYRDCCWQFRLVSVRDLTDRDGDGTLDPDQTFQLQFQMIGLGGFGGRLETLLERSIPGYGRNYANTLN